jgi:hypothetical protein
MPPERTEPLSVAELAEAERAGRAAPRAAEEAADEVTEWPTVVTRASDADGASAAARDAADPAPEGGPTRTVTTQREPSPADGVAVDSEGPATRAERDAGAPSRRTPAPDVTGGSDVAASPLGFGTAGVATGTREPGTASGAADDGTPATGGWDAADADGGSPLPRVLEATIDLPPRPEPRRTGRWLLVSVVGAIALAVLFPMAVYALRTLVSL